MEQVILDVREQDEFSAEHIPGSVWVPFSQFTHAAPGVLQSMTGRKILLMCRSGSRAKLALGQITQLGFGGQLTAEVYEGGILEWASKGKPVVTGRSGHLPLMRQVHLTAGLLVLLSVLLGFGVDQRIFWAAAFIGAGLAFAGLTGFCGLAKLLALMPWNKAGPAPDCRCG
ncbi:MAG: rhodanese-like domain-containing protein [Elusimicrobiota bacterium]|nr:rhodanese-like domain-containing protein [Elusimicrobiota bacterium]